jgi:hypothetical protein
MPFSAKLIRRLRRFLIGLACLATLLAVVWQIENFRGQRAWTRFVESQIKEGKPIDSLPTQKPIRSEENFFEDPAIKALLFGTPPPLGLKSLRQLSTLNVSSSSDASLEEIAKELTSTVSATSTADAISHLSPAKKILTYFADWTPELNQLREASRKFQKSSLVYPEPLTPLNLFNQIEKISMDDLMTFSRVLGLHSRAGIEAGMSEEVFDDALVHLKISEGFLRSPTTILQFLVGIAMTRQATDTVKGAVSAHLWTADQLRTIQEKLSSLDRLMDLGTLSDCLRAERNTALAITTQGDSQMMGRNLIPWWLPVSQRTWWRHSLILYAETLNQTCAILEKKTGGQLRQRIVDLQEHEKTLGQLKSPYAAVTREWSIPASDIADGIGHRETMRRLALTACALERHYLAHGTYPESLTTLVPVYLPAVPLDVIDGAPLRYRRDPDSTFTLYSLALDGDDDQGRRIPSNVSNDLTTDGDWAW